MFEIYTSIFYFFFILTNIYTLYIMSISRAEALEYLELPIGADPDSIRTSYKRLAQKWFPDKHGHSPESLDKFQQISLAYKRLTLDSEYTSISELEMYETYNRVVNQQKPPVYTNGFDSTDDDDEDEDSEEDILSQILKTRHNKQKLKQNGLNNNRKPRLTAEEIDRNAKELITEEEREKRKAEKRRAKKKRQREKKRLEKQDDKSDNINKKENGNSILSSYKDNKKLNDSSGSEAEEFDTTAAFFTQVKSKKKKSGTGSDPPSTNIAPKPRTVETVKTNGVSDEKVVDDLVLRSRQLAIEGNRSAGLGHYTAAIDLFTDAIKLDPRDFRFFGNRSYCYDRVQQYERALKDADKAISLAPEWPKGYFRKGRALAGLKLYADAEQAFMQVLKLDKSCEDAMTELIRVRTHQLTEMGFTIQQAEQAIKQYGTVQTALDSLLAGVVAETSLGNEIYESDDEDYSMLNSYHQPPSVPSHPANHHNPLHTKPIAPTISTGSVSTSNIPPMQPIIRNTRSGDAKMNPTNPEGLTALWVGNVLPDVSQTKLLTMFQKYGTVTSIRMLPEKYCAFVNFKTKEAASHAMSSLQDEECNGQRLLIKFPDNPVSNGNVVLRKGQQPQPTAKSQRKNNLPNRLAHKKY